MELPVDYRTGEGDGLSRLAEARLSASTEGNISDISSQVTRGIHTHAFSGILRRGALDASDVVERPPWRGGVVLMKGKSPSAPERGVVAVMVGVL